MSLHDFTQLERLPERRSRRNRSSSRSDERRLPLPRERRLSRPERRRRDDPPRRPKLRFSPRQSSKQEFDLLLHSSWHLQEKKSKVS